MKQIIRIALVFLLTMSVSTLYAQKPEKKQEQKAPRSERKIEKKNNDTRARDISTMGIKQGKVQKLQTGNMAIKKTKGNAPDGVDPIVAEIFPKVGKVVEEKVWNNVLDSEGNTLGYIVYSSPASDEIKGYAGPTPLLIAFDTKKNIISVRMLPNKETPNFRKHIEESGLLDSWNGMSIKEAKKKEVDAVSGATFTSKSIIESFHAILEKL